MRKVLISTVAALFGVLQVVAAQTAEGSDFMRSIGKIYVVVAVIAIVFIGITFFLFFLDRKLTKLENQIDEDA